MTTTKKSDGAIIRDSVRLLHNSDIDAHPMLDKDHNVMCRLMRSRSRESGVKFTMLDFARICLRATATDYVSADEIGEKKIADRALQHAALLFVYEALKACDHDIIKEWPEFNTMLKQLEDLGTLGLPT